MHTGDDGGEEEVWKGRGGGSDKRRRGRWVGWKMKGRIDSKGDWARYLISCNS